MKRYLFAALILIATIVTATVRGVSQDKFNHAQHAKLFPVCTTCHAGIQSGDKTTIFPAPTDCARCHDGKRQDKIDYKQPAMTQSNLKFDHVDHAANLEGTKDNDCLTCHAKATPKKWMNVGRAAPETCIACHNNNRKITGPVVHLAMNNDCRMCHVALKDAQWLPQQRIAAFPKPPSHDANDFLAQHKTTTVAGAAKCATCHTQESCSRCHANAANVKVITALGSNAKVASIVADKKPLYPKPADHTQKNFRVLHGELASASVETCSNCHTRNSCQTCHSGSSAADALARLPVRVAGAAPGVDLRSKARNAHPAGFANSHAIVAGSNGANCTSCHQQKFCSDCHQGADSRKFHPANFSQRHAEAVYSAQSDCASCHNRESFCQTCHTGLGMNSTGKRATPFHNAQAVWLLQHGQPARQNMESCASCHTQASCTRCHATNANGGWGVNPHGSMDVAALKKSNQVTCLRCHKSGTF